MFYMQDAPTRPRGPKQTQAPDDCGWVGVNAREDGKEIKSKKKKPTKKVESPAHDSSPITSVNPGARE